jgi:hypothetical protein
MSNPRRSCQGQQKDQMKYLGAPQSGSQANTTASHNRAGQYYRNRRAPVQPVGTGRRAFIRASFGAASTAWAGVTAANQAAWTAYANSHPITDALGQSITLTGQQMYVAIGTQLLNVGAALPTIPPVSSVVSAPVASVFTVTHLGVITLTLSGTGLAADYILISFSAPVSAGVTFMKTFWQQTHVAASSVGGATYGTAYVAQFGTIPTGSKVFLKLTPVNQYGVTGVPVIMTATAS